MSIEIQPALGAFVDWVRTTDKHATTRLALLRRVDLALGGNGGEQVPDELRRELAGGLEKWRYELLDACGGRLCPEDRGLCDALDLAANELLGRAVRAPRWPPGWFGECTDRLTTR